MSSSNRDTHEPTLHHGHHHHGHQQHHSHHAHRHGSDAGRDEGARTGWVVVDDNDGTRHPRNCQCSVCLAGPFAHRPHNHHNRHNHGPGPLQANTGTYVRKGTEWVVVDDYGEHPRGCQCTICLAGPPNQSQNNQDRQEGGTRGEPMHSPHHHSAPPAPGILRHHHHQQSFGQQYPPTRRPQIPHPINTHVPPGSPSSSSSAHTQNQSSPLPPTVPPPMWVQSPGTPYPTPVIPIVQNVAVPVVPVYAVPTWVPMSVQWMPLPPPAANPPGPSPAFDAVQPLPLHAPTSAHHAVEICPWLTCNPVDRSITHIKWDMSLPPTTAKRMSGTGVITSLKSKFNELATAPPVKHLQIICPAGPEEPVGLGLLWPSIDVKKHNDITLGDVLWAIYDFLNTPLSESEVNDIKTKLQEARKHFPYYESLERAAMLRAQASLKIGAVSAAGPLLRIDCMGSPQRFFSGMVVISDSPPGDRWWLVMYACPKPNW